MNFCAKNYEYWSRVVHSLYNKYDMIVTQDVVYDRENAFTDNKFDKAALP